ncbi:MAG TPA: tetratricopeptide repeat protein [Flavobacteriales bacterium]|nr:tetratricopeptide repeat protein [Flavobacteriales bacterium]
MQPLVKHKPYEKWRMATLVGVHLLFVAHFIHWKLKGRTLAPLEFNEVLYTIHQGIVTAGFVLMALVMVATLVLGRFFCSWGCHILALQDAAGWLMDKLRIKRQPIRSRTLIWVPIAVMFYLFIWPQFLQAYHGLGTEALQVVEAGGTRWSSFTTDDLWRNLPPPGVAVFTFFVCGFLIVYLLGSRGFCFQACPYGALFGLADQFAPGRIVLAKDCSQCGLCTRACSSDILVHRELAEHGMVTNPRCLKDLDCVAVCPENAVQFGFRKPPLFRKGHPMGGYQGRFSNSLGEDLFLAGGFLVTMPIYRGLYDRVPFLLSVALALCTAYVLLLGWRLFRRDAMQLRGTMLRMDRALRPAGRGLVAFLVVLLVLLGHSAVVQYHTVLGQRIFLKAAQRVEQGRDAQAAVGEAVHHYEQALAIGLIRPADRRQELASLYIQQGRTAEAMTLLEGIVVEQPTHVEARHLLAGSALQQGAPAIAAAHWQAIMDQGSEGMSGRSRGITAAAALAYGQATEGAGSFGQARTIYQRGLELVPGDVPLLMAVAAVESRMGLDAAAIAHYEEALQHGGEGPLLHNNLGALYLRTGRADRALPHYKALATLKPDDPQVHYTMGVLLARGGDAAQAMGHLTAAFRLAPNDERIARALTLVQERRAMNER